VSTPIGNLKDITLRALETLKKSTYILCEDTRVSRILLDRYEIKSRLISNHKFNESKNLNKIIDLLKVWRNNFINFRCWNPKYF
jgi:16S rRNA (cytidine1402-2'-O)-methyltransferase